MTQSASVFRLRSEFDDFLFAPIDDDTNGMCLSVISALARLDVDPWQEAAELTGLPGKTATERLTSLIASLPDGLAVQRDAGTIAARLIALLPRRGGSNIPLRATLLPDGDLTKSRAVLYGTVVGMVFVLVGLCLLASHLPSAQVSEADVLRAAAVFPQTLP